MDVRHISTEDVFLTFNARQLCLGLKKGPKDVHFTLSFHPNSDDMNFHVTRNTSDQKNKPQIVIAVVNKVSLESALTKLSKNIFYVFFEPLIIPKFCKIPKRGYHPQLDFISLSNFKDSKEADSLCNEITKTFNQSSKLERNGRRLRIGPTLDANFITLGKSKQNLQLIRPYLMPLSHAGLDKVELGYLSTFYFSGLVIIAGNQVFRQRVNIPFKEFAECILGMELTKVLSAKTKKALTDIIKANNYEESLVFNDPIRLFK
jgi:hypothetical protein